MHVHLRARDSGRSVRVAIGEIVEVVLDENPTTGFRWEVAHQPSTLELKGSEYVPDEPLRIGSGGRTTIRFLVVRSGSEALRLELKRSWEMDVGPAEVFEARFDSA